MHIIKTYIPLLCSGVCVCVCVLHIYIYLYIHVCVCVCVCVCVFIDAIYVFQPYSFTNFYIEYYVEDTHIWPKQLRTLLFTLITFN